MATAKQWAGKLGASHAAKEKTQEAFAASGAAKKGETDHAAAASVHREAAALHRDAAAARAEGADKEKAAGKMIGGDQWQQRLHENAAEHHEKAAKAHEAAASAKFDRLRGEKASEASRAARDAKGETKYVDTTGKSSAERATESAEKATKRANSAGTLAAHGEAAKAHDYAASEHGRDTEQGKHHEQMAAAHDSAKEGQKVAGDGTRDFDEDKIKRDKDGKFTSA